MLPSAVVRMEALPQTANGKVNRNALPAPDNARDPQRRTYSAPSSERERLLAEIWAEVLRVEQVGTSDNIFELGADSLHMFQIAARASKAGIPIAPASLLRYRTIHDVLKHLDETTQAAAGTVVMPTIVPVSREKYRVRKNFDGAAAK
jgi:aryl carrier-like protein